MSNRLTLVIAMIIGSFCLYCAPDAVTHMVGDQLGFDASLVGDGRAAEPCCTPPGPTFTKLGEWTVAQPIDPELPLAVGEGVPVGEYRELVLYVVQVGDDVNCNPYVRVEFRPDAETSFGRTGQAFVNTGSRVRVDGSDARLHYGVGHDSQYTFKCPTELRYILAGIR